MKEMQDGKESTNVVDISHTYVGPQQREALHAIAYDRYRKQGYSHNQATGLANNVVKSFVAKMDAERRAAAKGSE